MSVKLDIFHAQAKALHKAKAGAIQKAGGQPGNALQLTQKRPHFIVTQDYRHARWPFCSDNLANIAERLANNVCIEEYKRIERLVLRSLPLCPCREDAAYHGR